LQNGDLLSALAIPLPLWDGPLSEVPSGAQGVQGQPQQKPNTKERTRMRAQQNNARSTKTALRLHLVRNRFAKQRRSVATDLKAVYGAPTTEAAQQEPYRFGEKWDKQYGSIRPIWERNWGRPQLRRRSE